MKIHLTIFYNSYFFLLHFLSLSKTYIISSSSTNSRTINSSSNSICARSKSPSRPPYSSRPYLTRHLLHRLHQAQIRRHLRYIRRKRPLQPRLLSRSPSPLLRTITTAIATHRPTTHPPHPHPHPHRRRRRRLPAPHLTIRVIQAPTPRPLPQIHLQIGRATRRPLPTIMHLTAEAEAAA